MRVRDLLFPFTITLAAALSISCAARGPVVEMGPDADITHDGLHRVRHAHAAQRVWAKPGLDLSTYSKLLPVDAGFHYKRPPRRVRGERALDDRQMEFVREELRKAFEAELTERGPWTFVTERGPDVLVLRGAIIDFVVTAPEDTGPNRSYSASAGSATLVIELFDSQSLEILVRIADRRAIAHDSNSWRNDPMTNRAAARKTFRYWARKLGDGLETARTMALPVESFESLEE